MIIFAVEIYNYKELKANLASVRQFHTASDTEVLLEGYLQEGLYFFNKIRGIYSFALYDLRAEPKLILGRDPGGIKPLYYADVNGLFAFGSEIKTVAPVIPAALTPDETVIKTYLHFTYCLEPHTAFSQIKAVPPGTTITVTASETSFHKTFSYDFSARNSYSYDENLERVKALLEKATERNMTADVPVSVALSGGIDSSLIYAYGRKTNPGLLGLTIRFDDAKYNESDVAEAFIKHIGGNGRTIDFKEDFDLDKLTQILLQYDQPYSDTSALALYSVAKAAKPFSRVLLGGDGGDEIFNGYASPLRLAFLNRIKKIGLGAPARLGLSLMQSLSGSSRKRDIDRLQTLLRDSAEEMLFDIYSWLPRNTRYKGTKAFRFDSKECLDFYKSLFAEEKPKDFLQMITFTHFRKEMLSDYLRKTDMMAMWHAIEYRVPMLDEDLVQFALSIPFEQKASFKRSKKFLRDLHEKIYPAELSNLKKKGFTVPLDIYLSEKDFTHIRELISADRSIVRQYVNKEYIDFLFDALFRKLDYERYIHRGSIYQRIIMLYSLHLWAENKL
jgi:asparagine synthase (glutamine-hydrolysing)